MTIAAPTTPEALAGSSPDGFAACAVQLTKVYGQGEARVIALDRLTLGIPKGVYTAVMGPSGSGKSTLMHCLAGLDSVTSGEVYVGDIELGRLNDKRLTRLRRDRIGFVFQAFNLVPTLTAGKNITLPLDITGTTPDQALAGHRDRHHRPAGPALPSAGRAFRRSAAAPRLCEGTHSPPTPRSPSLTNPQGIWTPDPVPRFCPFCAARSVRWARPSSW